MEEVSKARNAATGLRRRSEPRASLGKGGLGRKPWFPSEVFTAPMGMGARDPARDHSATIPIHHMNALPTSTSYLRTYVSLPSSAMRKTDIVAGT
jgi:hypothetical protein